MFSEINARVKKAGQAPGTALYTGNKLNPSQITVTHYSLQDVSETTIKSYDESVLTPKEGVTWINVEGLSDVALIQQIANQFKLHPLTIEDILNVQQRPKVEEFDNYLFLTLKMLSWNATKLTFSIEQHSFVLGQNYIISFQESHSPIYEALRGRLKSITAQRLRQQGPDYLLYRFIDVVTDQYFVVLEALGEQIEKIEEKIISSPSQQDTRVLYRLKRQMLMLRKAIWPMREVINHLSQAEETQITSFTRVYLRDAYDHIVQAIDTIETFRDMLAGLLDTYLSSLTNRMNEVMKTLTIIATIFIPITFIASVYGMNFIDMPELHYKLGYPIVLGVMLVVAIIMLIYFRRKKWI